MLDSHDLINNFLITMW